MALNTADEILNSALPEWHKLLQGWAADGSLVAAAQEALMLPGESEALNNLVAQWSAGNFSGIPPIVLLPSADMNGAMGAYAISTGTIYLNADWLAGATQVAINAVLSEELGHHLDAKLNQTDTQGDEGQYFSGELLGTAITNSLKASLREVNDPGAIVVDGKTMEVELAESAPNKALFGNSLYYRLSLNNEDWYSSSAKARSLGGYLISIDNQAEQDFISNKVGIYFSHVMTGLSDLNVDGTYIKPDGSGLTYSNFLPGYPYPFGVDQPTAYALVITRTYFNTWESTWSTGQWYSSEATEIYNTSTVDTRSGEVSIGVYAEIPLSLSITRQGVVKEGAGVFTTSINLTSGTQTTGNLAEGTAVYWKIDGISADDLASGALTGAGLITNGKLDIQHSLRIDPDANEQFSVSVFSDSGLNQQIGTTSSVLIDEAGPAIRGNSLYRIVAGSSWTLAEANALTLGGHLTTISSQEENEFIYRSFMEQGNEYAWIGLNDKAVEGQFTWIDGASLTYQNWYSETQTAEAQLIEDEVCMGLTNPDNVRGLWLDASDAYRFPGIAEIFIISFITRTGSIKEGAGVFTTSINLSAGTQTSGNLAEGATVYWKIDGITADDLASGALTGSGVITNGKLDIQHSLSVDGDTGEQFSVSVFSDSAMTQQIGTTSSNGVQEAEFQIRGNSLYLVSSATDINEARRASTEFGGSLVKIDDQSENDFIVRSYSYAYGGGFWCLMAGGDISSSSPQSQWKWDDGTPMTYQNWQPSEPNGVGSSTVGVKIILKDNFAYWETGWSLGKWDDTPLYELFNTDPSAPKPLERSGYLTEVPLEISITRTGSVKEGAGVFTTSINLSAGTQTTGNLAEGTTVYWKIDGITADDLASGALTGSGVINNGKLDVENSLRIDSDANEQLSVSVFSDELMTQQIGATSSLAIQENNQLTLSWLSYSGQPTDEWSGGIATFSNGDVATAFSVSKSDGSSSVIVQRLSTNGVIVWSLDIGADYAPSSGSVLVGTDDTVYVTGGTKKGASGESGLNDSDIFAAAISPSGQKLWYKNYGIGIHEIGSTAVLDANGNILLEGRVSEVNDAYSFIKDVPNFYGEEFSGGWRGFQLRINPTDGSVSKAYTTGSGNSGGGPIAIDRSRNVSFVAGYTFGAVNGVNTVGNGDPNGANTYLIARNETTGAILWTRMENWMRSNVVAQESENAVYFVDKGNLEKVNVSTGQTIWSKALTNTNYVLSPITGGGVLLSESESNGTLTIRRFDSSGTESGSQVVSHTGNLYPRSFIEQGDGIIRISGFTSGAITVPTGMIVTNQKQTGNDSFVLQVNSSFSSADDVPSITLTVTPVSAVEDSTTNLIYTYTRTGPTANALTVNYSIGGTADGSDYTGATPGTAKTITFAAGSSTATLTIDPTADTTLEADETVALTLATGTGYTIGTASAVVGTISNDEPQVNRLSLDFATKKSFSDAGIDIRASFSNGSETATWIGGAQTARLSSIQLQQFNSGLTLPLTFSDKYKLLSEGETFAVRNLDGKIWGVTIVNSQSIVHGGTTNGVIVDYRLLYSGNSNSTPTGSPTLLGTPKPGSTLSVDTVFIQDLDNSNISTPRFSYGWEVSSDNASTWSQLTSTDATDNNNNYTLTAAENGKRLRSVISYKDGAGNNETLYSGPSVWILDTAEVKKNRLAFDFDLQTTFADFGLDIRASFSNGSEVQTWIGGAETALLTTEQLAQPSNGSQPLSFSSSYKLLSEGETFAVRNQDGKTWAVTIVDSRSRIHGGSIDGAVVEYWLLYSGRINSSPTGSPSITGTLKAGSTLSLDASAIKDDDNFSGYAPSYNYDWEVSSDNGITWTKLTSNDATDNNTTFTLTTAEVGKQIRGVASYLDGYGTNESIASAATTAISANNQAPSNLALSSSSFNENIAAGSAIATLSTTDPDAGNTFSYALVTGIGSADNAAFSIAGDQLKINTSPNFESKSSYSIRLRSTDAGGLSFEKAVTLAVNDLPEGSAAIESIGRTILRKSVNAQYVVQAVEPGSAQLPISKDGAQISEGIYGNDWTVLAAEQINGVNQLLWKNTALNRLHVWSLDANWNWLSSAGWDEPTSATGQQFESQFGIDLDGNGTVASPEQILESTGSITLISSGSNSAYRAKANAAGSSSAPIKKDGTPIYAGIYGNDWTVLAADTVNGVNQVLWKNTSANRLHVWSLDGNWNWISSSGWDEPTSAAAQQLEVSFQQDLNGDGVIAAPTTAVEIQGFVQLLQGTGKRYSVQGTTAGAASLPITKDGAQIYAGIYGNDWQVLAAETVAGVNQVLWKNTAANRLHVWSLDGNWTWTSSAGWDETTSSRAIELESQFGLDLNGDGTVAQPSSSVEEQGSIWLLKGSGNTYSARSTAAGASALPIKKDGVQISQGIYGSDWQVLAAETVGGVNQVLWKNTSANRLHLWSLDANWNWTSSTGWDEPNSAAGQQLESQFGIDLDGNGSVAAPNTSIETQGAISLLSSGSNRSYSALQTTAAGAVPTVIKKDGVAIYKGIYGNDWSVLAAETVNGVNQVLWKNTAANRLHLWSLDANWVWSSSSGWDEPNSAAGQQLESQFGIDLDGNGSIASPEQIIESIGSIRLISSGSNRSYSAIANAAGSTPAPIVKDGTQIYAGIYGNDWTVLAAEQVNGVNQVLWKNTAANRLHVWSLDTNWNWTSSTGWDEPASTAGQQLEASFGIDLDGNGTIAAPTATSSTIENKGNITLLKGSSNRYSALSTLQGSAAIPITNGGNQIYEGIYGSDWQVLAADTFSAGNQVLWINTAADRLHTWTLDANWSRTSSSGLIDPNSHQARELEALFALDLNGDGTVRTYTPGTTGVDLLTGTSADEFFSPLAVPASGGVDQIITGGGRNQILLATSNGSGNLYTSAKDADYLLIDGFNASNDQLLLTTGKPYASTPLSLGNISGVALFEDRNADGLYTNSSDELLALLRGISSLPSSSLVLSA
jgi:hypothetical protein